ncbi:MAG: hypothetical protein L3J58_00630 [Emcibacter sp.]|nr:hypothetical protein [Emcibacter sp.]
MSVERITDLIVDIAKTEILPRFNQLRPQDITAKSPGDMVTIADTRAEKALTQELSRLYPAADIAGEESIAKNPDSLRKIITSDQAFLIDPIDGTNNFIKGDEKFAVMLTQLRQGNVVAAWIYLPALDKMVVADKTAGVYLNGCKIKITAKSQDSTKLIGAAHMGRFPQNLKEIARKNITKIAKNCPAFCAGYDYISLVEGKKDFSIYYRTLPWDHMPGGFIFAEAGGYVRTLFNKSAYGINDRDKGLLSASSENDWLRIRELIFPGCF